MNVLFHVVTGLGAVVLLTDTKQVKSNSSLKTILPVMVLTFLVGLISHGALDYIPHCYPINSKLDVILGLLLLLSLIGLSDYRYKWIMLSGLLGCIFPDLIDLSPSILNKYIGLGLPDLERFFPWHWKEYSGSIYSHHCEVSTLNHALVILTVGVVLWARKLDLKMLLGMKSEH